MKTITKIMAVVMALALTAMVFAACGSGSTTESKADDASSQAVESSDTESKADGGDVDYSKPEKTITEFSDLETFAKELQSNGNQGMVVKITGINSRSNFGAKATISISDGDKTKIGTTYKIDGVDKIDDYPENDANIEITGVVTLEEGGIGCFIAVPKDQVVVK